MDRILCRLGVTITRAGTWWFSAGAAMGQAALVLSLLVILQQLLNYHSGLVQTNSS